MAVSNEIIIIALGMAFGWFMYPKSKFFGGIVLFVCGFATMAFNTGNTYAAIGIVIMLGSLILFITDIVREFSGKKR